MESQSVRINEGRINETQEFTGNYSSTSTFKNFYFRTRFVGNFDPQSSDLTQIPSGCNYAVRPATNHY